MKQSINPLVILLIIAAFAIGYLFSRVQNLENTIKNTNKDLAKTENKQEQREPTTAPISLSVVKSVFKKGFIHFGDNKSKLLFIEISDPSCPFCHIAAGKNPELASKVDARFKYKSDGGTYEPPTTEMRKLVEEKKASYAFLYANGHGNGQLAMQALYCAYEEGVFWEVHDILMTNEGYNLINNEVMNDKSKISKLVSFLKNAIDSKKLTRCLEEGKYEKNLTRDEQIAVKLGFQGTPHFVINTTTFQGAYSFSQMRPVVEKAL